MHFSFFFLFCNLVIILSPIDNAAAESLRCSITLLIPSCWYQLIFLSAGILVHNGFAEINETIMCDNLKFFL